MLEEGYWSKGLRVGKGRYTTTEGVIFVGDVSCYTTSGHDENPTSEAGGYGTMTMPSGERHEGYYLEGNFHGYGKFWNPTNNFSYEGTFWHGRKSGVGEFKSK